MFHVKPKDRKMGMFDMLHYNCPNCQRLHSLQTKADDNPCLEDYYLDTAPPSILADIANKGVKCPCGVYVRFAVEISCTVQTSKYINPAQEISRFLVTVKEESI